MDRYVENVVLNIKTAGIVRGLSRGEILRTSCLFCANFFLRLLMGIPSSFFATANIAVLVSSYVATAIPAYGNRDIAVADAPADPAATAAVVMAIERFLVEFFGCDEVPDMIAFGLTPKQLLGHSRNEFFESTHRNTGSVKLLSLVNLHLS